MTMLIKALLTTISFFILEFFVFTLGFQQYNRQYYMRNDKVKVTQNFIMSSTQEKPKAVRKPWELGRFVQTGNFYNAFLPGFVRRTIFPQYKDAEVIPPRTELWSKTNNNGVKWGPLDDVVMGGASKSDIVPGEIFTGKWNGVVTTANNGGFAGIRTQLFTTPKDISSCRGFVIRVKGDGNQYKFTIRDSDTWDGIAWSYSFLTIPSKVTEIKIPISSFVPNKRAKLIDDVTFNTKNLCVFQLTYSKFEYGDKLNPLFEEGPFTVDIEYIGTY